MIDIENVSKAFNGSKAVDDVSLGVKESETMVLLGSSGSGKTTTLKMINRLVEPDSGKISIGGADIKTQDLQQLRRSTGYVLQHNALFPHYTVAENIATVPRLLKWDNKKIMARTEELLDKMKLEPGRYLNAMPNELSGGQQQRVNIARALAADPPVLLMDEPFGALDPITRAEIVKDFNALEDLRKKTIVMVTHDVQEAFELGDKICVMHGGKIMQTGVPSELLFHPANSFVQQFLENQQMGLALKTVKVADIWPWLVETSTFQGESGGFDENSSMWDIMETATAKTDARTKETEYTLNGRGQAKKATLNDILLAYSLYRNSAAKEINFLQ